MAFNVSLLQFTRFWFNIILMIENVSFLTFFINSFEKCELFWQNAVLIYTFDWRVLFTPLESVDHALVICDPQEKSKLWIKSKMF